MYGLKVFRVLIVNLRWPVHLKRPQVPTVAGLPARPINVLIKSLFLIFPNNMALDFIEVQNFPPLLASLKVLTWVINNRVQHHPKEICIEKTHNWRVVDTEEYCYPKDTPG